MLISLSYTCVCSLVFVPPKRKMKENLCQAIKDSVVFGINSTLLILINPQTHSFIW